MAKLLPIILIVVGLAAGAGVGLALRPAPEEVECAPDDDACLAAEKEEEEKKKANEEAEAKPAEFVSLSRQFVIPLMDEEQVRALVVASLAVEVDEGTTDTVYAREPKLRDGFLGVLFVHAHSGGFSGDFTRGSRLDDLRTLLTDAARPILGEILHGVLITEVVRQDL